MSEKQQKAPKTPKAKQSMKFVGPNGELQIVLNRITPNNIATYVVHTRQSTELNSKGNPKKLRQRGATEIHKDENAAKTAIDKLVAQATKLGWTRKGKTPKTAKADSFDLAHLPAAAPVAATNGKK